MDISSNQTLPSVSSALLDTLRSSADSTGLLAPQFILLALLFTPVILLFPPKSLLRRALYPIQLYCTACAFIAPGPPGASQADLYSAGLLIGGWTMRILDRVYMSGPPEKAFRRTGVDSDPAAYGPVRKFGWALEMIVSQRGVGWNWQVAGVPPPDCTTRWGFVANHVFRSLYTLLLVHLVSVLASVILGEGADGVPEGLASVLRHPLFLRVFVTAGWLVVVYGHVVLPENVIAIFTVGTGLFGRWSDPALWPPMFNDVREAYSLRRFWGTYWHAMLRRTTNAPGQFLLRQFPSLRKPKSQFARLARRYGLLFLAFGVSGAIHAAGTYMVTRDFPQGWSDGGAMVYFLVQPAAIVAEDGILSLLGAADDGRPSILRRVLGYAYVVAWGLWCFPTLKVAPLAVAHRLDGWDHPDGELRAAVRACKELADAYPVNPARSLFRGLGLGGGLD